MQFLLVPGPHNAMIPVSVEHSVQKNCAAAACVPHSLHFSLGLALLPPLSAPRRLDVDLSLYLGWSTRGEAECDEPGDLARRGLQRGPGAGVGPAEFVVSLVLVLCFAFRSRTLILAALLILLFGALAVRLLVSVTRARATVFLLKRAGVDVTCPRAPTDREIDEPLAMLASSAAYEAPDATFDLGPAPTLPLQRSFHPLIIIHFPSSRSDLVSDLQARGHAARSPGDRRSMGLLVQFEGVQTPTVDGGGACEPPSHALPMTGEWGPTTNDHGHSGMTMVLLAVTMINNHFRVLVRMHAAAGSSASCRWLAGKPAIGL